MPRPRTLPACPACGGDLRLYCPASFLAGDVREILECAVCRHSTLHPLPSPRELAAYYHRGYYDFNRANDEGKGLVWSRWLKCIRTRGRFLDVGCATGFFLDGIRKGCAWEVHGIETGRGAADYARRVLRLPVKSVPLEKARYPKDSFDFIHVNNVLEHVPDPSAFLREASRILAPGGRFFLAVPNGMIDRLGYRDHLKRLGRRAASKDGHLHFFSPGSLSRMAESAGLRIVGASGSGLKRSLRVMGLWPRRKGWEEAYQGRRETGKRSIEDSIIEGKRRPYLYHWFQHEVVERLRWPGFPFWAYDFHVHMTK